MSSNRTFTPSLDPTPSDLTASTSGTAPSSGPIRTKRPKTSQACESCRKHKTRCEQSSEGGSSCHRCNVLAITCSFEGSDNAPPPRRSVTLLPPPRQKTPDVPSTSTTKPKPLSVEDLVVGPTHHLGEPEESAGYYAQSPLGAIWDIMRKRPSGSVPTAPPEPFNVSSEALSVDQAHYLMSLFDRHYLPWLNIPHLRIEPGAPVHTSNFLVLACCAIACRHLPPPEAERALSLLQPMAEHAVLLRTFDPEAHASLEGLQGLLVLATWTPAIGATHAQIHDSSLIATSAARMGMTLKLDTCSEKALALRGLAEERGTMSDEERLVYEELMWKVRLWVSVCNTEWILTTGTHRKPISVRSQSDYQALDWRRFPAAGTIADYRDFRLGIAAQVSDAAARGVDKMFKDLDQFFKDIEEPVMSFNYARNIVQPLRFAFTMERMQMDYLYFQQHVARLLVLFHGMAQIRAWMGAHLKKRAWILELEQAGVRFVKHWGMQIIHTAQTILGLFFEIKERYFDYIPPTADFRPLAAGPDALYAHVLFASSILLVSRYTLFWQFSIKDPVFTHSSAVLLSRLHAALSSLALGPEHAPRRAAAVINELQRVWHEKVMSTANGGTSIKMSLLSLAARAAENSDTTYSGSTAGTSNAGSSSCDDDPSRPQSHSPGGPMPPPVLTVPTSAAPTHVPPFPSVPVHPNPESYIPQQQYAYQHPHQHVDQHQQYLYPHQSSSQMPATAVADDPLFNELFSGFDQPIGVGSLNAQQQPYGQQDGIADPMSNFFPQMDPGNFLDNGFWDLFGNSVPADAAAPGSGGFGPQSNLVAMMFPQQ